MKVFDASDNFKEVDKVYRVGEGCYWIVCDAKEINELSDEFDLDKDCIEECKNLKQSAKILFFKDYLFIVFNILEHLSSGIISRELNIFLGRDYIITVYKGDSEILDELIEDISKDRNVHLLKSIPRPEVLLYNILDRIIVRNYNLISDLEATADRIEISILRRPEENQAHELIYLRRQVYKIRKYLNPLRYIGDSLVTNDNGIIAQENLQYFSNLNGKMEKLMQAQESLVQGLALVREAYESEISNKTNQLMKVFTIVAAIFLPLDLLSGIFALNLNYMPLKEHVYGFYIVLVSIIIIAAILLHLFKRKKWL